MTIAGTQIEVTVQGTLIKPQNPTQGQAQDQFVYQALTAFLSGTGAGKAQEIFRDRRTLTASSSENLDLSGTLVDALGNTVTLTKVKAILFKADPGNTNNVWVGNAASNGFYPMFDASTDYLILRPGACFALFVGAADATAYAVTGGTADLLMVKNSSSGTSVIYDVIIIGE